MSNENVTVLTDELGLQREYNEVKRIANVGERIKTFGSRHIANGTVITLNHSKTELFDCGQINYADGTYGLAPTEYVVLVQSDIVRIGSGRYRLEQRKANVGERVVVTYARRYCFAVGEIYEVRTFDTTWGCAAYSVGETYVLREEDSRVIVPLESAPLSAKPAQEQRDDIVANLAARVSALESEIATLKRPKAETLAEKMSEAFAKLSEAARNITPKPLTCGKPSAIGRDDVIERAKRDVSELPRGDYETKSVDGNDAYYSPRYGDRVNFVINRAKRTVVALLEIDDGDETYRVWARGIAKCAPDDVFNSHIGRAIALRRALALPVPDEYVTTPKPTEVRVGDIVKFRTQGSVKGRVTSVGTFVNFDVNGHNWRFKPHALIVIDDSREETEVSV